MNEYLEKNTKNNKPSNAGLINSITDVRNALLIESFWQDAKELIPADQPEWCEVWLSSEQDDVIHRFESLLRDHNIEAKSGFIRFPERAVKAIRVNREQLKILSSYSDDIAEYRRAKETAAFWCNLSNREQTEWVQDLLNRITVDIQNCAVCILDTGVNHGHPLLQPLLDSADCQSVEEDWGNHDHDKHGTLMAGVVGYGDLNRCLSSTGQILLKFGLESVKILPPSPLQNPQELWGHITAQAVSRAEIQAPHRQRIVCLAVTSVDTRDRGRPSSWSGQLDQMAAGVGDGTRRLIVVSAGNISDLQTARHYPDAQQTDSIHDPAQSWNALTVGACTSLSVLTDPHLAGYSAIAPEDGLSPFSTTSQVWQDTWPIKPEILMEGGNLAQNDSGFVTECDDLSVLSTYYQPQRGHFYPFNMTSAATAQAAWLAGQIQATYPHFWPETVRALIVHSATWSDTLKQQFLENGSKTAVKQLLKIAGYGIPNLERALYSASNSLTLIAQQEIQPYAKKEKGGYKTKDMHFYELPWPKEVLLSLPDGIKVEMRVTLSYFIEPGPGEIGWQDRYRYPSHLLRFELNSPGESKDHFVRRINIEARNEENGDPGTSSPSKYWVIGSQARDKGSLHSDIWQGTAAELADSNLISVIPRVGWWRERAHLKRWDSKTRYALLISISASEESVDIYTPVATEIGILTPVMIPV